MTWTMIVMGWLGGLIVLLLFINGCRRQDEAAEHVKNPCRSTME